MIVMKSPKLNCSASTDTAKLGPTGRGVDGSAYSLASLDEPVVAQTVEDHPADGVRRAVGSVPVPPSLREQPRDRVAHRSLLRRAPAAPPSSLGSRCGPTRSRPID